MFTTDQINEFVESIDMQPLYKEIADRSGLSLNELAFHHTYGYEGSGKKQIRFSSGNIADKCGVLGKIMREVYINNFNSSAFEYNNNLHYSIAVHFEWIMKDGGMNGTGFFDAYYEDGYWQFR